MFKDAKQLAEEAMSAHLNNTQESDVTEELLKQVLDAAWVHQSDTEPRRIVRERLKEQISRAANLRVRQGGDLEV